MACCILQEYSVQITFREDWNDPRLTYDDFGGKWLGSDENDRCISTLCISRQSQVSYNDGYQQSLDARYILPK